MSKKSTEKRSLNQYKPQFKQLREIIKPYRGIYLIGWIFLLLSSLMAMVFPALMGQLLGAQKEDEAIINLGNYDFTDINVILIALIITFSLQAVFSFFRIVIFNLVTEKVLRDIKQKSFNHLVRLPLDFYNKNKVGDITSRIATDINLLQETLTTNSAEFFRQILTIIISVSFILFLSWKLALFMLAVVPMLAIVALIFGRYIRKISKQAQEESAKSISVLVDVLTGIVSVKSFTNEKKESDKFFDQITNVLNNNIKSGLLRGLFVSFIIFCLFGGIALVIWKAKQMQFDGDISLAAFNAFMLYTIFIGASFGSLPELYGKIQKAFGATEKLFEIFNEEKENYDGQKITAIKQGEIEFKNVHFAYAERKELNVLNGINFHCEAGKTTAVVGSSGAGKSTLAALILKFYQVQQGEILIDGVNIQDYDLNFLRKQIAYVPQDIILFSGTIAENIGYGKENATQDEIRSAALKANALSFIETFPEGFNTLVGDRGIQLSGGQRQRIAIARAILKDPKILILDEATSALDAESEKQVQLALLELMKNRTSFVIAHRLSTIQNADNILVLENGKVIESGKHVDLVNAKGAYYKLQNLQFNQPEQLS